MKKTSFIYSGILFIFSVCFLLSGFVGQAFAARSGEACHIGTDVTDPVNCEAGVQCDITSDTSRRCDLGESCRGTCKKACGVYAGGPANGGCAADEDCFLTGYSSGYGGSGYCVLKTSHHIPTGSTCTREVFACNTDSQCSRNDDPDVQRGNCADTNAICDLQLNGPCSGGRCQGRCLPKSNSYTCNTSLESREGVNEFSCPLGYACAEVTGRSQARETDVDGGCAFENAYANTSPLSDRPDCTTDTITCPGCQFSCRAQTQVVPTCTCLDEGNPASGRNKIVCSNSQKSIEAFCSSEGVACYRNPNQPLDPHSIKEVDYERFIDAFPGQTLTGVKCRTPEEHRREQIQSGAITPVPPPAPPCKTFVNGLCVEVLTSFGAVGTEPTAFIAKVFGILLAAAGAIALLLIMRAGYRIMTARGNPEGLKEGREQIVAAIVGLMFLIFSFVLLQVIGVDLLQLPTSTVGNIPLNGTCDVNNPRCEPGLVCNYSGAQGQCQRP